MCGVKIMIVYVLCNNIVRRALEAVKKKKKMYSSISGLLLWLVPSVIKMAPFVVYIGDMLILTKYVVALNNIFYAKVKTILQLKYNIQSTVKR